MSDIKPGLWKNDNRKSQKHPHLKAGKPVNINGQEYWLSAWVNSGSDEQLAEAVNRMLDKLAEANGKTPIIGLSLSPAESRRSESSGYGGPSQGTNQADGFDDSSIPF